MRISVFGLGYVGAVAAACLAKERNRVIGVDPNPTKVELVNAGKAPIIEKEIGEITAAAVADALLSATTNADEAVHATDVSLVCVGTPSESNGSLNLKYVRSVCSDIGEALRRKSSYHVVVDSQHDACRAPCVTW